MAVTSKRAEEKYQEKQKRRKGLQKTRFYCQICERQCLDENGLKCHIKSEVHMRNLQNQLNENNGSSTELINNFSDNFVKDFVLMLKKMHGSKLVGLNKYYQEYIKDKEHVHLNSTKWKSITQVGYHLKNNGKCRLVDVSDIDGYEGEKLLIGYIDPEQNANKQRLKSASSSSSSNGGSGKKHQTPSLGDFHDVPLTGLFSGPPEQDSVQAAALPETLPQSPPLPTKSLSKRTKLSFTLRGRKLKKK